LGAPFTGLAAAWAGLVQRIAVVFFFSSRRRHTRFSRDWSSDVCSSDLHRVAGGGGKDHAAAIFPLCLRAYAASPDRRLGHEAPATAESRGSRLDSASGVYGFFRRGGGRSVVLHPIECLGTDCAVQRRSADLGASAGLEPGALAGLFL